MSKGFSRSSKALSVINRFNRVDAVLYVEGPTDRAFWQSLLDSNNISNISIKIAGSCTIIDDYIERIVGQNLKFFVARDKDYKFNLNKIPIHNRILLSFGHSIENTLIQPTSLAMIGHSSGGNDDECFGSAIAWQQYIEDKLHPLIIREFANESSGSGISVFGDHGNALFGKSWTSKCFPENKIQDKLDETDRLLPLASINSAELIVESEIGDVNCFIRGHFLFSIAIKFVQEMMSGILNKNGFSLSNDSFFAMLAMNFKNEIDTGVHPHKSHYDNELRKLNMEAA